MIWARNSILQLCVVCCVLCASIQRNSFPNIISFTWFWKSSEKWKWKLSNVLWEKEGEEEEEEHEVKTAIHLEALHETCHNHIFNYLLDSYFHMHTPTDINGYDYGQFYSNTEMGFSDATQPFNHSYRFIHLNSFSIKHS